MDRGNRTVCSVKPGSFRLVWVEFGGIDLGFGGFSEKVYLV